MSLRSSRHRNSVFRPGIEILEGRALPSTFTWESGASGAWSDSSHWTDGSGQHGVPGAADTAIIPNGSVSFANNTVGTLQFQAGTLGGTGTLEIRAGMNWSNGSLQGGTLRIDAGATMQIQAGQDMVLQGTTLAVEGMVIWTGSGRLLLNQSASIANSGTFDIRTDSTITATSGTGSIDNENILVKTAGSGTTVFGSPITVSSTSILNVQSGTINWAGHGSITDGFVRGGGTLRISGTVDWLAGTMADMGDTIVTATGRLNIRTAADHDIQNRTLENDGLIAWPDLGSIRVLSNTLIDNHADGTFDAQNDAAILSPDGGPWTFLNEGLFRKSMGQPTGETLIDAGSIFNNIGTVEVDAGTLNLGGILTNYDPVALTLTGGTFIVRGTFQFNDANVVTNDATLILDGPNAQVLDQFGNNGLANFALNDVQGVFTLRNGAMFTTGGDFVNAGQVFILGTQSQLTVSGNYTQISGTTNLTGGTLAAALSDIQAGNLIGFGTINGNLQNESEIDVGGNVNATGVSTIGTITVNGNFTQSSTGVLQIKLGDSVLGGYDQLIVTGLATLDGTLTVIRVNGFQPGFFDAFQILMYGSHSGDFAVTNPPDGYRFTDYTYHDDQGFLNVMFDFA